MKNYLDINKLARSTLLIVCLCLTTIILLWILKFSYRGIDITDEGYYLNWISNPFLYKHSLSQFGYIYHPIYQMVDGNIAYLRILNILSIFLFSWILIFLLLKSILTIESRNKFYLHIISSGLAISGLLSISAITTPSYNSLNFLAIIFSGISLILLEKNNSIIKIIGSAILGIGYWLTFMAKPSSALVLGILIFIYFLFSPNIKFKYLVSSAFIALLLLIMSSLLIDGSLVAFIKRYAVALELSKILEAGHTVKEIFRFEILPKNYFLIKKSAILYTIFSCFLIYAICIFSFYAFIHENKFKNFIFTIIALAIFFYLITIIYFDFKWKNIFHTYQLLQILSVFFAISTIFLYLFLKNKMTNKIKELNLKIIIFFFILPYVFAFGTNNNYLYFSLFAGLFFLISGYVFLTPLLFKNKKYSFIIFLTIITQLITSVHLKERFETPYRQDQSLRLNNSKITINDKNNILLVSKKTAASILNARNILNKSEFKNKTPIIDLGGNYPGLIYLLGGTSIGTPWQGSDYPGHLNYARKIYNFEKCENLAKSWLLTLADNKKVEINNLERIDNLMISLNSNFSSDYLKIGTFNYLAKNINTNEQLREITIEIYKPKNINNIINSCNKLRKKI